MKSILQDWVMELGLRHQGVLLTIVRGCDTAPKDHPIKLFTRVIRAALLNAHCGDPARAKSFIESPGAYEELRRWQAIRRDLDHYPHHYVLHLLHSMEVIGYKCPVPDRAAFFLNCYRDLCKGLHLNPETEEQLDARLNCDEEEFSRRGQ